jgi:hypothetical protein
MALQIERAPWKRIGVGRTKFDEDYVLKDEADPFVPGTNGQVNRLRPVSMGERTRAFFSDETDTLIKELRALRDATPFRRRHQPDWLASQHQGKRA